MATFRIRVPANRRVHVAFLATAALFAASCHLQEPSTLDGLDPDPATDTLVIAPQDIALPVGDSVTFVAPTETVDGTPATGPVEWTVVGGGGKATISSSGVFTATAAGNYTVQASRSGKNGRSKARVSSAVATLTGVKITPDVLTLQPGAAFTFSVSGQMSDGSTSPVTGTWTATGGTITSSGAYTAGSTTGSFRVIVTQQGGSFADTAAITITAAPATLQAIELTPATVTLAAGASQQFSAIGRMSDNSTSNVTVTWTATGGSVNSSGRYTAGSTAGTFRVIATEQGGSKADTSTVTITPPAPTLTGVELSPTSVNLAPGAAQQFSAIGRMSNGSTSSVTVTWSETGGSITSSGNYTAGTTAGTFRVIATQQGGTLADTATVTIAVPPPTITLTAIELTPATASLLTGATQQFSAVGRMSDNSTSSVAVTWTATGGTVSSSGLYTAGNTAGTYRIIATEQGGTKADTSSITVSAPAPTLSAVEISPTSVSLDFAETQQFSAVGRMSDGSTSSVTVTWTATGGTVSASGLYTAGGTAGTFRVIATQQGGTKADTAAVTITQPAPTLTAVELTPTSVSLNTGATQQFTAVGRMSDGSTSAVSVTYSATGGTVTTGGLYTAGSTAGTYRVIAVRQGDTKADTSTITVTTPAPTLSAVEVSPTSASVGAGATQQFSAVGRMSDNSTSSIAVTWSATSGTITSGGLYTAGSTAGTYRVIAVQQGGTKADTSSVTVTAAAPTLTAIELSPGSASVVAGATQQFSAVGRLSDNSTQAVTVTWSATGGTISAAGLYTAGATAGTYQVIAVQQGGSLADTSVVTVSDPAPSGAGVVLVAHRLAAGSGGTLISAGVPLAVGQLQPGAVSGVGLWRNGVEVGASIVALEGRYADGSVIALLVQYNAGTMTKGTPGSGYELRWSGSTVARVAQSAGAIKDVPDGVWALPPAYYKVPMAPVWGPLLPVSEATGAWAQVDADYAHAADVRWESCGEQVTGTETDVTPNVEAWNSKYDQPKNRIIYWARGGDIKNFERGLRQAAVARAFQQTWQQWHMQDVLSMSMGYWWTGVPSYRATVLSMAQGSMNAWFANPANPGYDDGRITGRNMGWALQAWLLGYGSTALGGGYTALQWLDGLAQLQLTRQDANGAWTEYGTDVRGQDQNFQSNFMAALRAYYLSLYLEYRGAGQVAGVSNAIRRNADFLTTQYDGTYKTWHYWSDWANGDAQVGLPDMRNLALMHTMAYYRAYHDGYGSSYLTQADAALSAFAANVPATVNTEVCGQSYSLKVFTEGFYLYQHAMAMRAGL